MPAIYSLAFLLLTFALNVCANPHKQHRSPSWLTQQSDTVISQDGPASVTLEAYTSRQLFLGAGRWLDLPNFDENTLQIWQSHTLGSQRKIYKNELSCIATRCQISVENDNRLITVENISSKAVTLEIREGHYQHHPSPYKEVLPLPLEKLTINTAHQHEEFFQLKPNQEVSVTFQQAQKLKLSVKQRLTDSLNKGKVYAFVDQQTVSIVPLSNVVAQEYTSHLVSISHDDYIAIPAQSTLTLKSYGNALIQITRSQRPFLDAHSAQKQRESLLNPYWINNLTTRLENIFVKQDVSSLNQMNYGKATALANKRQRQLVNMVTTRNYLTPIHSNTRTNSKHEHSLVLQGVRQSSNAIYPLQSKLTLLHHQLVEQLAFDLQHFDNATTQLTLFIRAQHPTQLSATLGNHSYDIAISGTGQFHRVELNNAHYAAQLLLNSKQTMLEVAVVAQALSSLTDSELLFMQPGKLAQKSPIIYAQLMEQQQHTAQTYLDSLLPYSPVKAKALPPSHKEQLLVFEQAKQLHSDALHSALPLLKRLINSEYDDILLDAWALRIKTLDTLNYNALVQRYLEGLIKHHNAILRQFAAKKLLARYQGANLEYKIQGLCALYSEFLNQCSALMPAIYESQGKRQLALWSSHDNQEELDHDATLLADLNYLHLSHGSTSEAPLFSIYHYGQSPLFTATGPYQAYRLMQEQNISIIVQKELKLKVSARIQNQNPRQQRTSWLHLKKHRDEMMLPIFADISSKTRDQNNLPLSVAATGYVRLKANEQLDISADALSYIDITVLSDKALSADTHVNHITPNYEQQPFEQLLNNTQIDTKTLLTNALKRLSNDSLSEAEFTSLFARVTPDKLTSDELLLFNRIAHFGHWQSVTQYADFLGTQLVSLSNFEQLSMAEQLTRHATRNTNLPGILLRPFHTLSLDISQLNPDTSKIRIHFSGAELAGPQTAKVTIEAGENRHGYTISDSSTVDHVLTTTDMTDGVIKLRWHAPYQSQLVSVQIQEKQGDQWNNVNLSQKQRFYLTDKLQPLVIELTHDALMKIEYLRDNKRHQVERFYPSGKHALAFENSRLLRAFIWRMTKNNNKLPVYKNKSKNSTTEKIAMPQTAPQPLIQSAYTINQDALNVTGYVKAEHLGESNFDDQLQPRQSGEWGVNFRYKSNSNWYKLGIGKLHSDEYHDIYQLNGRTDWLSKSDNWYAQARVQVNWQPQQRLFHNLYSGRLTVTLGQRWQLNETHTNQWWLQPHYFYTDAKNSDLTLSARLSPEILTRYKSTHPHGWHLGYQYWYQDRVDQRLWFRAQLSSNKDWYSIDNTRMVMSADQFYQGHILSVQLVARYAFNDEHRAQSQWQYLSRLGWQKWYAIDSKKAVGIALNLEKNWRLNEHSVALQITLGNVPSTGFDPFSYTEQSFKSLSFTQLMQQVSDE
ncbi:hypothetical protein [Pseudoalteromonas byunsanensis]|uniref:Uncharacterized protein n=1 Tax=Pseudoalteromonas byunsanensis TaxID=327939 RepID=A0A1S1N2U1_9GAMM|nr:hypothetical protein [Pseudoalteromonas byunsanensis]OHU95514.1 hypothetical protein BIW53_09790 [Pseudoalteromonas byunsanensis]